MIFWTVGRLFIIKGAFYSNSSLYYKKANKLIENQNMFIQSYLNVRYIYLLIKTCFNVTGY